jgi:hypothetical protein
MDEGGRYNVPSLVVPASSLMGLCIYMCSIHMDHSDERSPEDDHD